MLHGWFLRFVLLSGESNRPLTPILGEKYRDGGTSHFYRDILGKNMPFSWQKVLYTPPTCITMQKRPICIAILFSEVLGSGTVGSGLPSTISHALSAVWSTICLPFVRCCFCFGETACSALWCDFLGSFYRPQINPGRCCLHALPPQTSPERMFLCTANAKQTRHATILILKYQEL